MRQTIMLMAACAALLASCTNEVGEGLGIDTPIQVTASVEGIMTTRAENTEYNLDNFGLSIKDGQSYTSNYAGENIKVSKPEDASAWTLADEVLYKGSGQTYFAYAPYDAVETGSCQTVGVAVKLVLPVQSREVSAPQVLPAFFRACHLSQGEENACKLLKSILRDERLPGQHLH